VFLSDDVIYLERGKRKPGGEVTILASVPGAAPNLRLKTGVHPP